MDADGGGGRPLVSVCDCARKWVGRYRLEGVSGFLIVPRRLGASPNRTAADRVRGDPRSEAAADDRRRDRRDAGDGALDRLGDPDCRIGLGKRSRLDRTRAAACVMSAPGPGELVHIDVKKLGRIRGVGHRISGNRDSQAKTRYRRAAPGIAAMCHVAVDDYSRLAYVEVLADEKATDRDRLPASGDRCFFARTGSRSNASSPTTATPTSRTIHALSLQTLLGSVTSAPRPRRPQTNGKAERFIRTLINGWAYGAIYRSSSERTTALDGWLWHYNHRRRHSAIGHQPPITRTNLLGSYS